MGTISAEKYAALLSQAPLVPEYEIGAVLFLLRKIPRCEGTRLRIRAAVCGQGSIALFNAGMASKFLVHSKRLLRDGSAMANESNWRDLHNTFKRHFRESWISNDTLNSASLSALVRRIQ